MNKQPSIGLLVSMALRRNHGFDIMSDEEKRYALMDAWKAYEEACGNGFYRPELEDKYASLAEGIDFDTSPRAERLPVRIFY